MEDKICHTNHIRATHIFNDTISYLLHHVTRIMKTILNVYPDRPNSKCAQKTDRTKSDMNRLSKDYPFRIKWFSAKKEIFNMKLGIHPMRLVLAVFILISAVTQANTNYRFEQLTVDDGLSQSYINAIIQDHMGFLWIATEYGLNRYDGYNFKIYKYDRKDSTTLASSRVNCLYMDRANQLWVGTDHGLHLYDRKKDRFIRYQEKADNTGLSNNSIDNIYEDTLGHLWVATSVGLNLLNPENNTFTHFFAEADNPNSLTDDRISSFAEIEGCLWMATGNGLTRLDLNTMKFKQYRHDINNPYSLKSNDVNKLCVDFLGTLWIGYRSQGLGHIQKNKNGEIEFIHQDLTQNRSNPSNNYVFSFWPTSGNKMWIGTSNGGLNLYDINSRTFVNFRNDKKNPFSLSTNSIHALCMDHGGNVWAGTNNAGLNVIKKYKQAIRSYGMMEGNPNSLSHNSVTAFSESSDGKIWIGTDGGGLDLFDPVSGQYRHYNAKNSGLNRDAILDITQYNGNLWLCTWGGGVNRFNPQNGRFETYTTNNTDMASDNIMNLDIDAEGNCWIATNNLGLIELDPRSRAVLHHYTTQNSELHDNSLTDILVSRENKIYIGGYNGLCVIDPESRLFTVFKKDIEDENSLSSDVIITIFEADDGTIWVGTQEGLNRYAAGKFSRYYESDGLPNEVIMQIVEDDHHNLWVSTSKGLSRFNPSKKTFKNYFQSDGLQSNDFNRRSGICTRSGELYFGGVKGFSVFHPDSLKLNENPPSVVITDFQLANKPVPIGLKGSPLKRHISLLDTLQLNYQQNEFSFEFVALDFTSPEKNQYAYLLEGYDKQNEWHEVGTQRKATYTNMNPGKYIFRVKASNNDGLWNEEGASIYLVIKPPIWATWWFRIILILVIVTLVIAIYRVRVRSLAAQQRILQKQVEERTAELTQKTNEIEASYRRLSETGKTLASNSQLVNMATAEINEAMNEVKIGAISQSDFVTQTKQVVEALLTTIQKVNYETKNSAKAAEKTVNAVEVSTQSMQSTLSSMEEIEMNVEEIWTVMQNLMKHSTRIGEVIHFIEDIASRVNVLALNALIEAVKAEKYGQGFMVVAKEIRELAKNTTDSTFEISDTISMIQTDVSHIEKITKKGLAQVKQSARMTHEGRSTLDKICKSVREETERLHAIANKIKEMQSFSQKVQNAIESVASVSKKNRETVERVNASTSEVGSRIAELSNLAQSLSIIRDNMTGSQLN
jgi:methyl-accepting chemotaxis protein/ligand-binding sensor domain-containing protein